MSLLKHMEKDQKRKQRRKMRKRFPALHNWDTAVWVWFSHSYSERCHVSLFLLKHHVKHNNAERYWKNTRLVWQTNYGKFNSTSSISTAQRERFRLQSTETGNRQLNWDCEALNGIYAAVTPEIYFLSKAISEVKDKHSHLGPSDYSAVIFNHALMLYPVSDSTGMWYH